MHDLVCAQAGGLLLPNLFEPHSGRALAQSQQLPQESVNPSQILHHQEDETLPVQGPLAQKHCWGTEEGTGCILGADPPQAPLPLTPRRKCLPWSPWITQNSSKKGHYFPGEWLICPPNYQSKA